jgi:hypothetical protein
MGTNSIQDTNTIQGTDTIQSTNMTEGSSMIHGTIIIQSTKVTHGTRTLSIRSIEDFPKMENIIHSTINTILSTMFFHSQY